MILGSLSYRELLQGPLLAVRYAVQLIEEQPLIARDNPRTEQNAIWCDKIPDLTMNQVQRVHLLFSAVSRNRENGSMNCSIGRR